MSRFFYLALPMLLIMAAGPALAAPSFDSLDRNHDGHIKKEELYGQIHDYARWDRNDNGLIERNEFERLPFKKQQFSDWDRNGDGEIDSKEFYDGVFRAYDRDRNGRWTRREYREARANGLFGAGGTNGQ
ncbi:hypothetical protein [Salinisphaera hydrothermalis]|uniref:hypothetical protein n=1 Tax=Salinisphaera hydrothermalis TaxID=563188 RepID=UPI0033415193